MAKNTSKGFNQDESNSAERWLVPNLETMQTVMGEDGHLLSTTPLTAEQIQRIQRDAYKEAYDEGLEKGFEDGIRDSKEYLEQQVALLNAVLNQCASPMKELDTEVENQLIDLVIALTRQLFRREIKSEPGQIVAIVREAMQILPVSSRDVRIYLHPDDVKLIKHALASDNQYWKLLDDPILPRGDCKIQTESSSIDASMERRLTSLIANMLGDERKQDATVDSDTASTKNSEGKDHESDQ